MKLRIKVKKANNNGLCCRREGAAAGPGRIPKAALTDRLTSSREKREACKCRTKEIPADKEKTN